MSTVSEVALLLPLLSDKPFLRHLGLENLAVILEALHLGAGAVRRLGVLDRLSRHGRVDVFFREN